MRSRWGALDRSSRVLVLVAAWLVSRAAVLVLGQARGLYPAQDDPFDVAGFAVWGAALTGQSDGPVPLRDAPWEYPFGAVPLVALPALLRGAPYALGFVGELVLLDAALLLVLLAARGSLAGAAWWVAAVPLLGPVALTRFDVAPALLAAAGLLASVGGGPVTAGGLLAVGALVKLWPAAVAPLALLPLTAAGRVRLVAAGAVTGLLGLGAALAAYGPRHLLAPLEYQSARGLEVESLPALPLLLGAVLLDRPARVTFAFGSYQVDGPGAGALLAVADAAVPVVVGAVLALAWRARRSADRGQAALVLAVLLVAAVLCVDKVLSAQYPLWLAAVLAAALVRRDSPLRPLVPLAAGVLLLSQVVYPLMVRDLVLLQPAPVLVLAVRDLLLLALTARCAVSAWRVSAPSPAAGSRPAPAGSAPAAR